MANRSPDGKGTFRFITGNEIAALLTHFKLAQLQRSGSLPAAPLVISTEVTTGQIVRIGRHFEAQVVGDLLVGFKYHADALWQIESTGQYGDVRGSVSDFVIATEESHGIMATAGVRDKDSACAALLLAEAALYQKRQGRTLVDYLDDLNRQFGYFRNELLNIVLTGLEGKIHMGRMLDALRRNPPTHIGGLPVESFEDLQDADGRMGPFKGDTDKAARNFLIFRLAGDGIAAKVCLRPSGTEPKAKSYIEVSGQPWKAGTPQTAWDAACAAIDARVQQVATDFLTQAAGDHRSDAGTGGGQVEPLTPPARARTPHGRSAWVLASPRRPSNRLHPASPSNARFRLIRKRSVEVVPWDRGRLARFFAKKRARTPAVPGNDSNSDPVSHHTAAGSTAIPCANASSGVPSARSLPRTWRRVSGPNSCHRAVGRVVNPNGCVGGVARGGSAMRQLSQPPGSPGTTAARPAPRIAQQSPGNRAGGFVGEVRVHDHPARRR